MGKKQSIREKREAEALRKKNMYREMARKIEEAKLKEINEANQVAETNIKSSEKPMEIKKEVKELNNKSKAKAAGVKSTFAVEDRLIMTAFGRGNEAIIEKHIKEDVVENVSSPENYSANVERENINVKGWANNSTSVTSPFAATKNNRKLGQDIIGCKDALEMRYFGRTFNDNIHIQLIYNILDIEKILAVYANNIVYTINNIARKTVKDGKPDLTDFIGIGLLGVNYSYERYVKLGSKVNDKKSKMNESYEEFISYLNNPRLGYFGNAFYIRTSENNRQKNKSKYEKRNDKEIYNMLALLDELRQSCVHDIDYNDSKNEREKRLGRAAIYNLDNWISDDIHETLDQLYWEKTEELKNFATNSSKSNFTLLFDAMNIKSDVEKANIAKDYYRFSVIKEYKNIGFSVKQLRESVINRHMSYIKDDKRYDSVRSKLYSILDFMLVKSYPNNSEQTISLVNKLRTSLKNDDKEKIYNEEADLIWPKIKDGFGNAVNSLEGIVRGILKFSELELSEEDKKIVSKAIDEVAINGYMTFFSEFIYMLTLFLDGKEINDLLTTLINKFDNIASIEKVIIFEGLYTPFTDEYASFFNKENFFDGDNCIVLEELRKINSFARMSTEIEIAKRAMYEDAAQLLGIPDYDEKQLEEYIDENFLDKKKLRINKDGKPDTGFRNFVANNVIESWRFKYIVRYTTPKLARSFIENRAIVEFVFKDIPDLQIDRYYKSCTGKSSLSRKEKVDYLIEKVMGVQTNIFSDVEQNSNANKNIQKQSYITVVSLYLNVIYQVTKNLVNINSRYVIAFHNLERDGRLCGKEIDHKEYNHMSLTKANIERDRKDLDELIALKDGNLGYYKELRRKNRIVSYCEQNISNSDEVMIADFRNNVAHLNAVRNANLYIKDLKTVSSYFEIYHYLIQRGIIDSYNSSVGKEWIFTNESSVFFKTKEYKKEEDGNKDINCLVNEKKIIVINGKSLEYMELVKKYNTYCKDFVKALCSPFIYNLARFKNLSIEALFDKNRRGENIDLND